MRSRLFDIALKSDLNQFGIHGGNRDCFTVHCQRNGGVIGVYEDLASVSVLFPCGTENRREHGADVIVLRCACDGEFMSLDHASVIKIPFGGFSVEMLYICGKFQGFAVVGRV